MDMAEGEQYLYCDPASLPSLINTETIFQDVWMRTYRYDQHMRP